MESLKGFFIHSIFATTTKLKVLQFCLLSRTLCKTVCQQWHLCLDHAFRELSSMRCSLQSLVYRKRHPATSKTLSMAFKEHAIRTITGINPDRIHISSLGQKLRFSEAIGGLK